ncbi:hypothetical protein PTE30175_01463 [Pandoraea terrae]|uniref:DUF1439 domain-containing protein n=1 Tax=Pandoraea terrae TaxID=1537710 RepID=A0A5E4TRP4_9BURK|nr:DUF1439 domain-containing protein [Pandoraea terrae]VVD89298.1 hypothetical protein PTE30175_01463 [Pandoraea terrae]
MSRTPRTAPALASQPSSAITRRGWLGFAAATLATGLAGCAGFPFGNDYTFSESQLQRALDRKFPFDRRMLAVLDISLTRPRLTLLPDRNRIAVAVDASVSNPLGGAPLLGTLAVESALAYDPATRSIVLRDPEVDDFTVAGLPDRLSRQLRGVGAILAEQLLEGTPIYTFKPEQLTANGVSREPGAITVLPHGVNVKIERR